jgi:hypothetical protein
MTFFSNLKTVNGLSHNKVKCILFHRQVIELDHAENYFSFEFSAHDLIGNNLQHSYKLEGVGKEWVHARPRNFVSYHNLNDGKYVFKGRAIIGKKMTRRILL